jgi:hypothetical protein
MDSPGLLGGLVYLYFHMNWGGGGSHNGWFAFNDVNLGMVIFNMQDKIFITKP